MTTYHSQQASLYKWPTLIVENVAYGVKQ